MKPLRFAIALFLAPLTAQAENGQIISIGGSVTEIVYALGQGHRLVARDTTSSWPPEVEDLPDVGYMRALSAEGVLAFAPELIISEVGAGPPETIDVLRTAQVEYVEIPDATSRDGVIAKILAVGDALSVPADALAAEVNAALAAAEARAAAATDTPKKVLFVLSTQGGRIMASGTGTGADGIIRMAGGENAVTSFEGYKPLTDEAVSAAAPDVILMMDRGGDHAASNRDLFAMPAIATTPAAKTESVVRINGLLLLGFGPRTAEAVTLLSDALYPEE